jgi:glutamate N-acetyltransferase/amino-acid N-acetyltransferase
MTPVPAGAEKNTRSVAVGTKSTAVRGFEASAVCAEIKKGRLRPDLTLIYSRTPAAVAAVFTRNRVQAAPILINRERIVRGVGRAVLANSGNANACTGLPGLKDAKRLSQKAARLLGVPEEEIFLASTGVIGRRLPLSRMMRALPDLVRTLSPEGLPAAAEAIMTTDTFPKIVHEEIGVGKKAVRITALAKGAGMIRPDMATMLCFVLTDLAVHPALLQELLRQAVDRSFHRITVDGDTSTNDMVLVLANGQAENPPLTRLGDPNSRAFSRTLDRMLLQLARLLIRDGEGATKEVTLIVQGAASEAEARTLALTVAHSPLVKTALYGQDANWGRILAALGRAGVPIDPLKVEVFFDRVQVVKNGIGTGEKEEQRAASILKKRAFTLRIRLNQGNAAARIYTCDLSLDYVRINAEYRT